MAFKAYKYTFKLHISHSIAAASDEQQAHNHTIKIVLYIQNREHSVFSSYDVIEKAVEDFLKEYEGKYINNTTLFQNSIPTIENIGMRFYTALKEIVLAQNFDLLKLEISETPTRIFSISEKLFVT